MGKDFIGRGEYKKEVSLQVVLEALIEETK